MGFLLHKSDVDAVIAAEPEAIERVLKLVKDIVRLIDNLDNWNKKWIKVFKTGRSSACRKSCLKTLAQILKCF